MHPAAGRATLPRNRGSNFIAVRIASPLALFLVALCLPSLAHAQLRFGASAELNRTSFGGVPPDQSEYASHYGTGFAGIIEYRVHRDVVLSLQPGWMQKGAKIVFNENEEPDSAQTFTVKQTWATIPVYFRIDSDNQGFYAGGGLSLDILLDSKVEHEGVSVNNKDFFDRADGVYQFLAGYMHSAGTHSWFVEARYLQGMANINSSEKTTAGDFYVADFKSNGLRLVAGFLF
jgi:Outer membrane protein beta-barrel domain